MKLPNIQRCSGQMVLALIVILGSFFILFTMLNHPVPSENRDLVNIVIGILFGTGFSGVIAYYFGSSIGSRNKENTIETLSKVTSGPATIADIPAAPIVQVNQNAS